MESRLSHSVVSFEQLVRDGVLSPIHQSFGDLIRRLDPDGHPDVPLAAALTSDQLSRGHTCLELDAIDQLSLLPNESDLRDSRYGDWPAVSNWLAVLNSSPLVSSATDAARQINAIDKPLVLDAERRRVYLARYWFYERKLAATIVCRLANAPVSVDDERIANELQRLFPDGDSPNTRDQRVAIASAIDRSFGVITGGPGTGKTTTVARLLALRLTEEVAAGRDPTALKVLLMAPTGKAAQRLNESLGRATEQMDLTASVHSALQGVTAGTIHRMLGWTPLSPERGGPFRHNADHPLDADIVLVDEASMVDLSLMYRLFDAVPERAQIILMGDRDQLASVEAGGVLGDLCRAPGTSNQSGFSVERCRQLGRRTGLTLSSSSDSTRLDESVVTLRFSHRFSSESLLGRFATAIRNGDADAAVEVLRSAPEDQLVWLDSTDEEQTLNAVVTRAAAGYESYLDALRTQPEGSLAALIRLNSLRVLCAHRDGRFGEASLNRRIAERLTTDGWLNPGSGRGHYPGRPIMVSRNDYRLNIFNGDVGIVVRDSRRQQPAVLFEDPAAPTGLRRLPSALVADARDCFAMTIHKSQGSEFHHVLLVLPQSDSPVLSRELLYTAVTRVKDEHDAATGKTRPGVLCISATEAVLRAAIDRQIRRAGGIREAIDEITSGTVLK
jgi:exodeoxyribonuclease V alpha subunit